EQDLKNQVTRLGLTDKVVFAGRLSDEALQYLYCHASLFCLPSIERSEAFGVVLIEAMAYGLPVVATRIAGSGVPWVNEHETSGLNVEVGSPAALADACNKILSSSELRERFSLGARRRFLTEFNEYVSVRRLLDI